MTQRALIVGSETGGLSGVANDVESMSAWLEPHGFEVDVRCGADASRDGILDGLARIAADSRVGDAALIYYSGHGGRIVDKTRPDWSPGAPATPSAYQYLVPTDHDRHRNFRGIFRAELAMLIRDLSDKTQNITVLLDCCRATDMVREDEIVAKCVAEPWNDGVERHIECLQQQGYDLGRLHELRNPFMVLLAASETKAAAYEYNRRSDGRRCGLFTDALLATALGTEPSEATWEQLMFGVAEYVERRMRQQRPQGSGPLSRVLFSERERRDLGALRLLEHGGRRCLYGGSALGVEAEDRYEIVELPRGDRARRSALVTVEAVSSSAAMLDATSDEHHWLRPGLPARPNPGGPTRARCRVRGDGSIASELRTWLGTIGGLTVVDASDRDGVDFSFCASGPRIEVRSHAGSRLRWPFQFDDDEPEVTRNDRIEAVVELAQVLTRALRLRTVADRSTDGAGKGARFSVEWGVVKDGINIALPLVGETLSVGDRIYVHVANHGSRQPLHVSVLDVGVGWDITLLTAGHPEGEVLGRRERQVVGQPPLLSLMGLVLHWPDDVPPDQPLEESIVVFVADGPLPIASWATQSSRSTWEASHRDSAPEIRPVRYETFHIRIRLRPPNRTDQGPNP